MRDEDRQSRFMTWLGEHRSSVMKVARAYTLTNDGWGECSYFFCEVSNMSGQRCTLALLSIAVNCWIGVPIASAQNLTDQWVEKAAGPLVEKRVVDGLSVGYIEGEHSGIVHLGSSHRAREKANDLTVYEIGSASMVFTIARASPASN